MTEEGNELFRQRVKARQPINGEYYHRLINGIINDVNKGLAPVIVVSGQMGKGKSMGALELTRILHNEVKLMKNEINEDKVKENLVYDALPFLEFIYNNKREVLIFDEAGVNLNSKEWYSKFNRSVDKTLQTMRKNNCVYIFIAPTLQDLDNAIINVVNYVIEFIYQGCAKVTKIENKYGKIENQGSDVNKYPLYKPYWTPDLPPKPLMGAYREKEEKWKDDLLEDQIEQLREEKRQEEREKKTADINDVL